MVRWGRVNHPPVRGPNEFEMSEYQNEYYRKRVDRRQKADNLAQRETLDNRHDGKCPTQSEYLAEYKPKKVDRSNEDDLSNVTYDLTGPIGTGAGISSKFPTEGEYLAEYGPKRAQRTRPLQDRHRTEGDHFRHGECPRDSEYLAEYNKKVAPREPRLTGRFPLAKNVPNRTAKPTPLEHGTEYNTKYYPKRAERPQRAAPEGQTPKLSGGCPKHSEYLAQFQRKPINLNPNNLPRHKMLAPRKPVKPVAVFDAATEYGTQFDPKRGDPGDERPAWTRNRFRYTPGDPNRYNTTHRASYQPVEGDRRQPFKPHVKLVRDRPFDARPESHHAFQDPDAAKDYAPFDRDGNVNTRRLPKHLMPFDGASTYGSEFVPHPLQPREKASQHKPDARSAPFEGTSLYSDSYVQPDARAYAHKGKNPLKKPGLDPHRLQLSNATTYRRSADWLGPRSDNVFNKTGYGKQEPDAVGDASVEEALELEETRRAHERARAATMRANNRMGGTMGRTGVVGGSELEGVSTYKEYFCHDDMLKIGLTMNRPVGHRV
ncbi:unnamed protein product [Pedinophyceae sp. YPF-701]|nr:unnamed protein product [Pedinophyceae sp. YPF-701]